MNVKAGIPIEMIPSVSEDELSMDDLDNVYAGLNRETMIEKAMEHSGLFRESQIDALVEAQIKSEELDSTYEEQSKGLGL